MITENANLTEQTVEQITEMIAASGLDAGETFATEAQLEKRLNVSRPIIREAVSRLRALGLLESKQCVGLIVSKPDPVGLFEQALNGAVLDHLDLQQLAQLRYTLEIGSIELIAREASQQQLDRLTELAEEFAKPATKKTGRTVDDIELDFHQAILEATGNEMLRRMHNIVSAYFVRSAREVKGWDTNTTDENSIWEHRAIAQALSERNIERARAILSGHLAPLLCEKENENKEKKDGR
ncbi:FadR/GntR family transcriptional regulator [Planctomycetota bacterium]